MSLMEFSRDIVPILALVLAIPGVCGIFLLYFQLRLAMRQIELGNLWHRTHAQHSLLSNLPDEDHEKRFWAVFDKYKNDEDFVTEPICEKIYGELDEWVCVKMYMNKFESLCAAINCEYVDFDYAYHVHSAKIVRLHHAFRGYIQYVRKIGKDEEIFLELEKTSTAFENRDSRAATMRKNEKLQSGANRPPELSATSRGEGTE